MNGRVAMKYQPNVLDLSKINGECTDFSVFLSVFSIELYIEKLIFNIYESRVFRYALKN